jgi:hypothetical protein
MMNSSGILPESYRGHTPDLETANGLLVGEQDGCGWAFDRIWSWSSGSGGDIWTDAGGYAIQAVDCHCGNCALHYSGDNLLGGHGEGSDIGWVCSIACFMIMVLICQKERFSGRDWSC